MINDAQHDMICKGCVKNKKVKQTKKPMMSSIHIKEKKQHGNMPVGTLPPKKLTVVFE